MCTPRQQNSQQTNRSTSDNLSIKQSSLVEQGIPALSPASYTVLAGDPYQLSSGKVHGWEKQDWIQPGVSLHLPPLLLNLQNKGTPHLDTDSRGQSSHCKWTITPNGTNHLHQTVYKQTVFIKGHIRAKHNESFFRVTACNRTTISFIRSPAHFYFVKPNLIRLYLCDSPHYYVSHFTIISEKKSRRSSISEKTPWQDRASFEISVKEHAGLDQAPHLVNSHAVRT